MVVMSYVPLRRLLIKKGDNPKQMGTFSQHQDVPFLVFSSQGYTFISRH